MILEAKALFGGELGPIELAGSGSGYPCSILIPSASSNDKDPVSKLIFELSKLPGIGEKTATRLAYHILKQDETYARTLSDALMNAKQKIGLCGQVCFTFTDTDPCRICANTERDHGLICVVERPSDVFSIEQSGSYKGVYHVLHGALSPLDGIGPEELKIRELLGRLHPGPEGSRRIRPRKSAS